MALKAVSDVSFANFIDLAEHMNNFTNASNYAEFLIDGEVVGLIRQDVLTQLKKKDTLFSFAVDGQVTFHDSVNTYKKRTKLVGDLLAEWREAQLFVPLHGWRDENYLVKTNFSAEPSFEMERSATSLFGLPQFGCHCNGYVISPSGELSMWIGRRSNSKQTYPGMMDNLAAGGLSVGLTPTECMRKECEEEADVPAYLLDQLKPVTWISYIFEDERGVFREGQFVFDLKLPEDFKPRNIDGEVQDFTLVPVGKLPELILRKDFKPNCALVILDFLMRHGFVTPESEPDYPELTNLMHRSLTDFRRK